MHGHAAPAEEARQEVTLLAQRFTGFVLMRFRRDLSTSHAQYGRHSAANQPVEPCQPRRLRRPDPADGIEQERETQKSNGEMDDHRMQLNMPIEVKRQFGPPSGPFASKATRPCSLAIRHL